MNKRIAMSIRWILFVGILAGCLIMVRNGYETGIGNVRVLNLQTTEDADCTFIFQDDVTIMIDAGTKDDSRHILDVLELHGINKIDYMILTHGDLDHIGAVEDIVGHVKIEKVIQSGYEPTNENLVRLNECFEKYHIPVIYPSHTMRINIGQMNVIIYTPLEKHYNDNNNYSLVVLVNHKDVNMVFAGDALRKRSEELLYIHWPEINYYKVPHHGRVNSMTETLFDELSPDYAVVTSTTADHMIYEVAEKNNTEIVFTGQGDCLFVSDGSSMYLSDLYEEKGEK